MNNIEIKISELADYSKRIIKSMKLIFFIAIVLLLIVGTSSKWIYGIIVSALLFIIQYYKSEQSQKFFITYLKIENNQVIINYKYKNKERSLIGDKAYFEFKKKLAFLNRSRIPYLAVYYKSKLVIKQFEIGKWGEDIFEKVINSNKLIQKPMC